MDSKEGNNLSDTFIDENKINITDILDVDFLQKFQDSFSNAIGVASLTTDKNGVPVTNGSNFTDFCMKLSRKSKEGLRRCMESDAFGGAESSKTGKPAVYFCGSGLMDFGAPITVNGKQIGSVLGGQVLPAPPDKDKFIQIAKEIDVDPDMLLAAIDQVKIVPEDKLKAAADLLYLVTNEFSRMGYQRLILKKVIEKLDQNVTTMMATIQELTASSENVTECQTNLNGEIQKANTTINQITNLSNNIKSISGQSRLLGLNASIEAARAGDLGRGFSVVAEEIQKMAGNSQAAVNNITQFTSEISNSMKDTIKMSDSTMTMVNEQESAIKSILNNVNEIVEIIDALNKINS